MEDELLTTTIKMPRLLIQRVKEFAEGDERSMSYIFRKAVQKYLDENEPIDAQKPPAKSGAKERK